MDEKLEAEPEYKGWDLVRFTLKQAGVRERILPEEYVPGESAEIRICGLNLRGIELQHCDLRGISFVDCSLRNSDFRHSNLEGCDLSYSNFRYAILSGTILRNANLSSAVLDNTYLKGASLDNATLSDTCLVEGYRIRERKHALRKSLQPNGGLILYRTSRSQHVGKTVYFPGRTYVAPYFSESPLTDCHPGIYANTKEGLESAYPNSVYDWVRVYVPAGEWFFVSWQKGFRCKRIRVLNYVEEE